MNEEEKEKEKANIFASIIVRCIFIHTVGRPVFGAKARPSNQRYHWSLYLKKPMESVTSSVEFLSQLRLASTEPGNLTCQHFFHPSARHLRILHTSLSTLFVCLPSLSTLESKRGRSKTRKILHRTNNLFFWKFHLKIRAKKEKFWIYIYISQCVRRAFYSIRCSWIIR